MNIRIITVAILLGAVALFGETLEEFAARLHEKLTPVETYRGEFVQTRELSALGMSIDFKGSLIFDNATFSMLWRVDAPVKGAFRMHDGELAQWDGDSGKSNKVSAERLPWIKVFQEHLHEWLAGDLEKLSKSADLTLVGERKIRAVTKEGILKKVAESIEMEFSEDLTRAECVTIQEKSGDRLIIRFKKPIFNKPIDEKEWEF